jgi:PAS domain S-box-containing protein
MRETLSQRHGGALAFVAVAACYAALLGKLAYPYSIPVFLIAVIAAARVFGWMASATALGASSVILSYFVIPPIFSFRLEGRPLSFFIGYAAAAFAGSAAISAWKDPWIVSAALSDGDRGEFRFPGSAETERAHFVVTCDAEGSLLDLSAEGRRFTGASSAHYSGFRWLELVHKNERRKIVELIGRPSAAGARQRCRFRRFDGEFRWFEILVEPRAWNVIEQEQADTKKVNQRMVLSATEVDSES